MNSIKMEANQALTKKQQCIIPIAAFTANGDLEKLKTALEEGLAVGLTVNENKVGKEEAESANEVLSKVLSSRV